VCVTLPSSNLSTFLTDLAGGILLGPTAFGRIPGFTKHIFPDESRPYLSLVANIGLALFLFLVGLEIDAGVIRRNAKLSMTVALAGMVVRKSHNTGTR
jgi:Kef-type K+ transport system membrane component KefB